ncbi:unnamed protein product [Soboliphyme baturini]|uniref:AA_permease domain-containing protein n=1 Tax=Soboliphyme baturini TaxID=241478 RepID=A0A183ILU0_9BILA|nr:unnamed protein product [Soboliphyme baturini]
MSDDEGPCQGGGNISRNSSRFLVNRVATVSDSNEALNLIENDHKVGDAGRVAVNEAKQVKFSIAETVDKDEDNRNDMSSGLASSRRDTFQSGDSFSQNTTTTNYTTNLKSFRNVQTMERVPNIDHYRNVMSIEGAIASRPSLAQLHEKTYEKEEEIVSFKNVLPENEEIRVSGASAKLGWIQGVFMRCVLSILGTILFLRISWISGHAGILFSGLIILLSSVVSCITALSMCAICTNGELKGGGAYFMISRSLGPQFGGSIGVIFSLTLVASTAMCTVGFAETIRDLLRIRYETSMSNSLGIIRHCDHTEWKWIEGGKYNDSF